VLDTTQICRFVEIDRDTSDMMDGSYYVLDVGTAVEYRLCLVEIYASDEIRLDTNKKAYLVPVLPLQIRSCVQKVKVYPFQIFWS